MIETTESPIDKFYQNESSNSESVASNAIENQQNDSGSSLNSTTRSSESENVIDQMIMQKSCNEELSAFIKHYFSTNRVPFQPTQQSMAPIAQQQKENEIKKPKKSFLICDILGLNYTEEKNKTELIKSSQTSAYDTAISTTASNFLLNFNYSNLVSNLMTNNNKRNKRSDDEYEDENRKSKEIVASSTTTSSINNSKKFKLEEKQPTITKRKEEQNQEIGTTKPLVPNLFPAWVYCTRYSDRPSAG